MATANYGRGRHQCQREAFDGYAFKGALSAQFSGTVKTAHGDAIPRSACVPSGIKDSPPYLHEGRLLTLDDTVEFFNLVLGTKLSGEEKRDLVAFLRTL